jgi:hypothetical protein
MKITRETKVNNEPLLGAKVIFTKHSERNKKSYAYKFVSPDKVYEVVGYSNYPNKGCGPQIRCDDGDIGDVPMDELDYDIVSMPEKSKFTPITIVLETRDDLLNLYHNNVDDELIKLLKETK